MVKKKGKREKTTTLSKKKEEACNVSEQRDNGWIHVIRVHDTTHLAVTTRQGNPQTEGKEQRVVSAACWGDPASQPNCLSHRA